MAAGTASTGFASSVLADNTSFNAFNEANEHLAIYTRVSAQTNDIEAVFLNAGDETLSIDALTPHEITTFRGKFDVQALTANKPLVLAPGESVSVAVNSHDKSLDAHERINQGQSLSRALETSASAISTAGHTIPISVNQSSPLA